MAKGIVKSIRTHIQPLYCGVSSGGLVYAAPRSFLPDCTQIPALLSSETLTEESLGNKRHTVIFRDVAHPLSFVLFVQFQQNPLHQDEGTTRRTT